MGFVFLSLLIFFGLIHGHQPEGLIGGRFIFDQGGLFPNGRVALLTAMVLLLVNYQGSEIIGLAAGESIETDFTFVSTGGGAMLDFLANETLPGVEALDKSTV